MHIEVNQLSKRYKTLQAVNELSFTVNSGEIFAILGPNGAGKSSTIRMLVSLTTKDSGEIIFKQHNNPFSRLQSEQFGYLPEERGLYQDVSVHKILHYVAALKGMRKADAEQQIQQWLTEFELDDRQKEPLKSLSKGNQQKIQLLSSIIHRPELVILDEPFSGLDPMNQEKVISFLKTLQQQGTTVLLSAHQMSLVEKLADRLLLMANGKSVLYGDMQTIRSESTLGSELLLELETMPEQAQLDALQKANKDVHSLTVKNSNSLQLQLLSGCQIPNLLQALMASLPISNLQLQQPGLHEIYLHALSGNTTGSQPHE